MSNNNPTSTKTTTDQKKSRAARRPQTSQPSSTREEAAKAVDALSSLMGGLAPLMKVLEHVQPLLDFHKESSELTATDLMMYWDVRLVSKAGEAMAHTQGSSTLPGALNNKNRAQLVGLIQHDIIEKIARPITVRIMEENELRDAPTLDRIAARRDSAMLELQVTHNEDDMMAAAHTLSQDSKLPFNANSVISEDESD